MRPFILLYMVFGIVSSYKFNYSNYSIAKEGRIFSNIFGLLGNDQCVGNISERNATGFCYNELECLLK